MNAAELARLVWHGQGAGARTMRALLLPAAGAFRAVSGAHHLLYDTGLRRPRRAPIAVIAVGNLRVGGAGKTPIAGWIVDRLVALGRRPAILHGGYGLDEPDLHRRWHPDVPVLVGRERTTTAAEAASLGCDVVVLDDGFQHRRLARDLDIVLLAAEDGIRPVRLLPRGPWREPLSALGRADVLVITRKTASHAEAMAVADAVAHRVGVPPAVAWLRPARWTRLDGSVTDAPTGGVLGVAALAEPDRFFETVRNAGVHLAGALVFPDHHEYSELDVDRILGLAAGRAVATSAKDAVKLARLAPEADIRVLELEVEVEQGRADVIERIRQVWA